ncbi:hypothetical protein LZ30DRAFT_798181, partial [Colletotrichum cereale]
RSLRTQGTSSLRSLHPTLSSSRSFLYFTTPSDTPLMAAGGTSRLTLLIRFALVDLMKHIPHVLRDKEDDIDPWMVYEKATAIDLAREVVLCLSTKYARESLFAPYEGVICSTDISPHDAPEEEDWRSYRTYTFHEFFPMAKDKYRKFEMTAMLRRSVEYTSTDTPQAQTCTARFTGRSLETAAIPTEPIPTAYKIWILGQSGYYTR